MFPQSSSPKEIESYSVCTFYRSHLQHAACAAPSVPPAWRQMSPPPRGRLQRPRRRHPAQRRADHRSRHKRAAGRNRRHPPPEALPKGLLHFIQSNISILRATTAPTVTLPPRRRA